MLKEVTNASQNEKGILRRIFIDDFFELFVWYYKPELKIKGFQLCYDVQDNEHAVTWLDEKGFVHNKIDTGKRKNQTPLLVADGIVPVDLIISRYKNANTELEPELNEFVLSKLYEFKSEM